VLVLRLSRNPGESLYYFGFDIIWHREMFSWKR
jgi:hypothetical protein